MKIGFLLLAVFFSITANADAVNRYTPEFAPISDDAVELVGPIYRLTVPLQFLKGAKLPESNGLSILLADGKGISITTENSRSVGVTSIPVHRIPGMLAKNDFSEMVNKEEREDLEAMSQVTRDIIRPETIGHLPLKTGEAFVFIGQGKSLVLIASAEHPDIYASISIDGLSKQEIDTYLLQGALK